MSDNLLDNDVIQHLASIGVSDKEVGDALRYATSWLRVMVHHHNPVMAQEAQAMLNAIRTTPADLNVPQDTIEPGWWEAPPENTSSVPSQNKQKQLISTTTLPPVVGPLTLMYTYPPPEPWVLLPYSISGPSTQTLEPLLLSTVTENSTNPSQVSSGYLVPLIPL